VFAETGTFDPNVIVQIMRRTAGLGVNGALTELKEYAATKPQGTTTKPDQAEIDSPDVAPAVDKFRGARRLACQHAG
jgi:hypothetical protein